MRHTKTLKIRVRDKHVPLLRQMARSVNLVWNYLNELSQRSIRERGVFLSAFDMHPYTKVAGTELGLHSQTLQVIAAEYVIRSKQFKKARLNSRKSGGVRRSRGWIPLNTGAALWTHGLEFHNCRYFKVWDSYGLGQYGFRSGSFNEDARGRWYFNVVVEVEIQPSAGQEAIGLDLGLKDVATCSDGSRLEHGRFYRDLEPALAIAHPAAVQPRARRALRHDHRGRRQLTKTRQDRNGQVGAGCRLGPTENDAGLQVRSRRHRVQGSQRGVHHPNLQLLWRIAQQQAER